MIAGTVGVDSGEASIACGKRRSVKRSISVEERDDTPAQITSTVKQMWPAGFTCGQAGTRSDAYVVHLRAAC